MLSSLSHHTEEKLFQFNPGTQEGKPLGFPWLAVNAFINSLNTRRGAGAWEVTEAPLLVVLIQAELISSSALSQKH